MVQFTALLEDAWSRERLRPLAVVPFLVSFAYVDNLRRLRRIDGTHFGVSFGFPQPVATVWTFVNVPLEGGGVNLPSMDEIVLFPVVAVLFGVVAVALVALPLAVALLVVLLVVAYLFYAAPYLVVAADVGLVEGFRRSFVLATEGGAYFEFFVKYVLAVAVVSLAATPLVVNLGVPGAVVGALLVALPALTLNVATMLFVRSLIGGSASPSQSNIPVDM